MSIQMCSSVYFYLEGTCIPLCKWQLACPAKHFLSEALPGQLDNSAKTGNYSARIDL